MSVIKPEILAPYKATPQFVVEQMLSLANLRNEDVLFDLGCGDGRILITAAKKYRVKCVGVDIEPEFVNWALRNAEKAKVQDLITIYEQDAMSVDLSDATVVTLYLLPDGNVKLQYRLWEQLRVGARVISHDYWMEDWAPRRVEIIKEPLGVEHVLYLWEIEPCHKRLFNQH
jgi:tRNA G37 N-methylase Trm5